MLDKISSRWHSLPRKTRVKLIAAVLLVFAGTEVLTLAPYIFDIALMIDVCGFVFVIAACRASVSVSMMELRELVITTARPLFWISEVGDKIAEFGFTRFPKWYRHCFLLHRFANRCSAAFLVLLVALLVMKVAISIR
jgi:hypothetical protein